VTKVAKIGDFADHHRRRRRRRRIRYSQDYSSAGPSQLKTNCQMNSRLYFSHVSHEAALRAFPTG
jgi:hypothetical protein